ncbi:MAG: glycosyltransferase family 9 protein [Deltaproteobacteria bacterium]|nr:glycosyltransferase family 9 protein [Deltaproteobacteria bacterium]MBW2041937.1 glycosyltransferase family 9 protein [Deltaproteobacteria bacterium]MBW2132845.1 glycosyltransferase family 9 protein [Deltaproteobacteria bacterium]
MSDLKSQSACGVPAAALFKGRNPLPKIGGPILLIQLGDIGDVVLSVPALLALQRHFAGCDVWMGVRKKAEGLLEDIQGLAGVIGVDAAPSSPAPALRYYAGFVSALRRKRFSLAVDLRTGTRGTFMAYLSGAPVRIGRLDHGKQEIRKRLLTHLVRPDPRLEAEQYAALHHLNILAAVELPCDQGTPVIPVPAGKKRRVHGFFESQGIPADRPVVAVSPFSLWSYKEWRLEGWTRVIRDLVQRYGVSILVTGSRQECARARALVRRIPEGAYNLAGKTPMEMLPALFAACRLFVGVDSGSLHVAAAVGTPTVALFGPSSVVTWAPRGKRHLTVSKDWPCLPCRKKGCDNTETSRCLEELTAEEVLAAVDQQLG